MASSAQNPHHRHLPTPHGATSAPPPTPSTHNHHSDNTLSHLLLRLPPTLSLPTRRSYLTHPPLISLSDPTPSLHPALHSAATNHGFFNFTHNLQSSVQSTAESLLNLTHEQKQLIFPNNWPLGYDDHQDDDVITGESVCFDPNSVPDNDGSSGLDLGFLYEFGREMEKLGLKVVEELASVIGFKNPARHELYSLMWISDVVTNPGRVYPYVVGLHYQFGLKCGKYSLLSDSGWVNVSERDDSVLVTIGDIAQVWSNGKLKKVRGRPVPSPGDDYKNKLSRFITLSLLITLPLESNVCPLLPGLATNSIEEQEYEDDNDYTKVTGLGDHQMKFHLFSFEDYAWRVYSDRLHLKDPLARYRV